MLRKMRSDHLWLVGRTGCQQVIQMVRRLQPRFTASLKPPRHVVLSHIDIFGFYLREFPMRQLQPIIRHCFRRQSIRLGWHNFITPCSLPNAYLSSPGLIYSLVRAAPYLPHRFSLPANITIPIVQVVSILFLISKVPPLPL